MKSFLISTILLISGIFSSAKLNAQKADMQDSMVLVDFFHSTNGPSWTNTYNWLNGSPVSTWGGVTLDANGKVNNLSIYDNNLTGSLPSSIGQLDQLQYFFLNNNSITGSIPTSMGNLTNLLEFFMSNNKISGSIPPELGNLKKMYYLYLDSNQLTGSIPKELGGATALVTLLLDGNQLSGSIPAEVGNLSVLYEFNVNHNQLTGNIPATFNGMSNLHVLDLSFNQLTGSIPDLGNLPNIIILSLTVNQLTGTIPVQLGNLITINHLFLDDNQLTGTIPPQLGQLTNLTELFLHRNQLTGTIPTEFGNLVNLVYLTIDHNQLTGVIPSELGNLTQLTLGLDLSSNQLVSPVPATLGNLPATAPIYIGSNKFSDFIGISDIVANHPTIPFDYAPQDSIIPLKYVSQINEMSVTWGGKFTDIFHWYKDGALVTEAAGLTTYIPTVCGKYWCTVTNQYATKLTYYSDTVLVSTQPSLGIAGSANNVCAGTNVTFTATITNTGAGIIPVYPTLSYQWIVNSNKVGTNSATFSSTALANNDVVSCILSTVDACGKALLDTSNKITMIVNPVVKPTFTQIGPLCLNSTAPVFPTTSTNGVSGSWTPASIATNVVGKKDYIFTPSGTPCAIPDTMTITVTAQVTPNFVQVGPVCVGSTPPVLPTTSTDGVAGTWSPLPVNTATPGDVVYTFTPTVVAGSCAINTTMTIKVVSQVTPNFVQVGPVCMGSTPPVLPTTSTDGVAGTWSPLPVNTATPGDVVYTFTPTIIAGSCALKATMTIKVVSQVTPNFVQVGPVCVGSTPPVLPTTSTDGIAGTWSPLPVNTATPGDVVYTFTPTVVAGSCALKATMTIKVVSQVTPNFTQVGPVCVGSTPPVLPTTSTDGITGTWSPLPVSTATQGETVYTFTPTVVAGSCAIKATMTIKVVSQVTPNFVQVGPLCVGSTPPVLPTTSTDGIAGTWSPLPVSTAAQGETVYTFTPTVVAGSCALKATMTIKVVSQVTPNFTQVGPVCVGSTPPVLPTTSTDGITGTWSPLPVSTATQGETVYTFTPTVVAGSCALKATMTIKVVSQVTPNFVQVGPVCVGSTPPVLPTTSTDGIAGTWSPLPVSTAAQGETVYTFTPTVSNSCVIKATMTIKVVSQLTTNFNAIGPLCQNTSAPSLPATSTNGVSGTWSPSKISTAQVGTATYTFTPSSGQCGTTTTMDVEIKAIPVVKTGPNQTIEAGATVGLTATITGVSENEISGYLWSPSDGLSNPATINPNASPATTTTYTLDVSTDAGCKGSGSTTITVNAAALPPLGIPNAFSPNGDGINDTWVITNISYYPQADISVFNRYGHLIYQTQGAYTPWDGNYNGTKVPFGTYYYIIDTNTGGKKKSGSVTIFR